MGHQRYRLALLVLIGLLGGCLDCDRVKRGPLWDGIHITTVEGHDYVIVKFSYGIGITHAGSCKCIGEKN